MRKKRALAAAFTLITALAVGWSVLSSVAQLAEFRPIRASGVWQSAGGAAGTWSAELGIEDRALHGEVTVVDGETFAAGELSAAISADGRFTNAQLSIDGEVVATVSGLMQRRGALKGTFTGSAGESGEWQGDWYGIAPTVDVGWSPLPPRASPEERNEVGTAASATAIREGVRAIIVETNKLVSQPSDNPDQHQLEVEVAADRSGNSQRIALASIDPYQYPNIPPGQEAPPLAYYISPDGGDTWPASLRGNFNGLASFPSNGADPVLEYDRHGDLYFCGVAYAGVGAILQAVFLSRMPAGTNAFLDAVFVHSVTAADNRDLDKPWCTSGRITDPNFDDIVYVTYSNNDMNVNPNRSTIDFNFSVDAGQSFLGPLTVSDPKLPTEIQDPAWPQVAVGTDQKVNFVWVDNNTPTTTDIKFDQCAPTVIQGTANCGADETVAPAILKPDDPLPNTFFEMSWFPYLAIDNVPGGSGLIYVVWNAKNPVSGNTDIYFSRSEPQNIQFATPVAIVASSTDDFFPAISVDQNHFVRVVFFARVSSQSPTFNIYEIFSGSGGNTWSAKTKINDGPAIDPLGGPPHNLISIRDYIGIDTTTERHPGWMDSREGEFDVYSAVVSGC